jgi:hypothetical protein
MRNVLYIVLLIFSLNAEANSKWESKYDNWTCSGEQGIIQESYDIAEMFNNNLNADAQDGYSMLCTLSSRFIIKQDIYTVKILFPNCEFNSDNKLIAVRLLKNNQRLESDSYQIGFPNDNSEMTSQEIAVYQQAKLWIFTSLMNQEKININIKGLGIVRITLDGLRKALQSSSCS